MRKFVKSESKISKPELARNEIVAIVALKFLLISLPLFLLSLVILSWFISDPEMPILFYLIGLVPVVITGLVILVTGYVAFFKYSDALVSVLVKSITYKKENRRVN